MTTYALYVIDHTNPIPLDKYNDILTGQPHYYFDKLRGYAGLKGNTEYVAFKITI